MAYSLENLRRSEDTPKFMSLQLLNEITDGFSEERKLGSGTYGDVYKGVQNGEEIAVKRLRLVSPVGDLEQFVKELGNLWRLRHQNIVKLVGYCYEIKREFAEIQGKLYPLENIFRAICFEYMDNGSLQNHLYDEFHGLDWPTRYKIIKGTCQGLKYLHEGLEAPIYHLDLKPDNILLDKNMEPKLADFGLSKLVCNDQTQATQSIIGTWGYLPPEYIDKKLISKKLDIFSLGVVMIRIMTGHKGYYKMGDMSSQEFIELVHNNWRNRMQTTKGCIAVDEQCIQVKRCIEIALDCVKGDRKQRPKIGAIIQWLNETEHATKILAMGFPTEMRNDIVSHVDTPFKDGPVNFDSEATSNVCHNFRDFDSQGGGSVIPKSKAIEYNLKFYMNQTISGPNCDQVNLANPKQPLMFGYTNVHDYAIYDGLGPTATEVARAQGLHTETCMNYDDWFHWSSIVFSDIRFRGSSIKALGNQGKIQGEWAIVGGTGLFIFAKGTINIYRIQGDDLSNIKEIHIHLYCCPPETTPTIDKMMQYKKTYSRATSNSSKAPVVNSYSSDVTPAGSEFDFNFVFYMNQTTGGPNHNQVNVLDPKHPMMFGYTNVHDYQIYDSLGPTAKIVARAQGLHAKTSMNYDDWLHWSSILFTDERFQGSSLKAIGNQDEVQGEWVIIGGTGLFTLAQGTISIYRIQGDGSSNIKEIRIRAFCQKHNAIATVIKPFGEMSNQIGTNPFGEMSNQIGTNVTINDGTSSMTNPQSGLLIPNSLATQYIFKLYMQQDINGQNKNQVNIADPEQPMMFGYTNVHDYPIYDRLGLNARLVARAQGLHTETDMNDDDWFHWSSILFSDERFRGSSFKAVGNQGKIQGEWAIVGGTGLFTYAQGTISIFRVQHNGSSNIKEICINAYCYTP